MAAASLVFRREVRESDSPVVGEIVRGTGFFTPAEVAVAVELVDERLARGPASGYEFVFAEQAGRVVGYTCYGQIAATEGSYDLYWIAVAADRQRAGVGAALLVETERLIAAAGGRRVYVETSGREQYMPTRGFYERNGYLEEARLKDFYRPGDDKVVYVKVVG